MRFITCILVLMFNLAAVPYKHSTPMSHKKLSVIIPAYNAQNTIYTCLDSIYNVDLDMQDFEVIVIDDCSTDNTLPMLCNYASCKPNMRILHQEHNQRQGAARNRGIKEAQGEYIAFVDADDEMMSGIVEALSLAEKLKVDMLFCNTLCQKGDGEFLPRHYDIPTNVSINSHAYAEKYYDTYWVGPWTYLWKGNFLRSSGIPFVENRRMEDFDFVEKHIVAATSIAYFDKPIYRYYCNANSGSTIHTSAPDTVGDWVHVSYRRMNWCDTIHEEYPKFTSRIEEQCRIFVNSSLSLRRLSKFSPWEVKNIFGRIGNDAFAYFRSKNDWSLFTQLCLYFPILIYSIIAIIFPLATSGRWIVRKLR